MANNLIITTPADLEQLIQKVVERVVSNHFQIKNKDDPDLTYPAIMGTEQAASFLGIAESTLYRYTSKRLIPYHKRYQKLYFKKADLQQWLDEGQKRTVNQLITTINKNKNEYK